MADFDTPKNRTEAILQNMLGADNELTPPQSRVEAILQNMLGATYEIGEPQSRIEELLTQILEQGGGGVTPTGTINITQNGTFDVTNYASANVNVQDVVLTSIAVTKPPNKVTYNALQYFSKTGMVVTAYYSDGTSEEITGYTYSPITTLTAANTEITISYTAQGVTKTTTQAITVNRINPNTARVSYDLGGKVATGGITNVSVSTNSDGAISAVSRDTSKLTVNSVTGKNINVTKLASSGTVMLAVDIAQTDIFNSYSRTFTLAIQNLSVYDENNTQVEMIGFTFTGNIINGAHCEINATYSVYKNGAPLLLSEAYVEAGVFNGDVIAVNNTFTVEWDYFIEFQGDYQKSISDNIIIDTKSESDESLTIPLLIIIFYEEYI